MLTSAPCSTRIQFKYSICNSYSYTCHLPKICGMKKRFWNGKYWRAGCTLCFTVLLLTWCKLDILNKCTISSCERKTKNNWMMSKQQWVSEIRPVTAVLMLAWFRFLHSCMHRSRNHFALLVLEKHACLKNMFLCCLSQRPHYLHHFLTLRERSCNML